MSFAASIRPTVSPCGERAQTQTRPRPSPRHDTVRKRFPFLRLLDVNGKVLFLGASARAMTFYHGLEELLETELPVPPFTPEVFELQTRDLDGRLWTTRTRLFSQARRDTKLLVPGAEKAQGLAPAARGVTADGRRRVSRYPRCLPTTRTGWKIRLSASLRRLHTVSHLSRPYCSCYDFGSTIDEVA